PPDTTSSYALSLHDALPIYDRLRRALLLLRGRTSERAGGHAGDDGAATAAYQAAAQAGSAMGLVALARVARRAGDEAAAAAAVRSEEHTSELQSRENLVCRL